MVNSQTTQFVYDGDGNLVEKVKPDGTCTIYPSASLPLRGLRRAGVGGVYEVEKAACGGAVTHTKVYYPAGGAMRVNDTLYFVLKDHLGSSLAITGADGTLISEQRYMPYGQERAGIGPISETDVGFTGQRDVGMGLMDYKARFYDPYLGRFIQADTIVPEPVNPQAWNRYSYTNNNPIRFSDPTGHFGESNCSWCNVMWFNYSSKSLFLEDTMDFVMTLACAVPSCHVDIGTNTVWGPTTEEHYSKIIIVPDVIFPVPSLLLAIDSGPKAGTLSDVEARKWYLEQEAKIPELLDPNVSLEEQARQAFELRNSYRTQARELMANRQLAETLGLEEPNLTWDQVVQKATDKGYTGNDIYRYIIESSQRSRPSVNDALNLHIHGGEVE